MSDDKRDFDAVSATWDEDPGRLRLAADVRTAILQQVQPAPTDDALDFGCGTGLLSLPLAGGVRSLTGVDSSAGMLDVFARKAQALHIGNAVGRRVDLEQGETLGGAYDLVMSSMTLHHIRDVDALLRSLLTVLRPGGRLCLADLDPDGGLFHSDNSGVHHFGFDRTALSQAAANAGFVDVTTQTASEMVKTGADGVARRFSVFLLIAGKPA